MIVLSEAHLRRILKSYARYYNGLRTHRSLTRTRPSLTGTAHRCHFHATSLADSITIRAFPD